MTTIAFSPERDLIMDFSHASVFDLWGQVFLRPGSTINTISDLDGLRVAVMDQDISGENFIKTAEKLGITCDIISLPSQNRVFDAIQKGEVAAGVATQHFGLKHAKDFDLVASSIQFSPFSVYFAAKNGRHHTWLNLIDSYISRWKQDKDSYYYKRLSYWMGSKEYEKEITATLADILSRHGYKVRAFTDGVKALETFKQEPDTFDLVVTDMTMPGITGSQLAREMLSLRPEQSAVYCLPHPCRDNR